MPKQLLIETRMNSLSLCESKSPPRPGYLGTLYGPCADYKNPTRNNNFYGRKLWENVFNNDVVKESLEDRILIGELDHPGDRLETKATNACLVMTDKEFHDDEGLLYGKFDILDTPNGRILRSLLDYGCKIGVSSRGEGDVTTESLDDGQEVNVVDEDNYEFVAFDAVVLPAVKAAKPSLKESLNHISLRESLQKEVDSATSVSELDLIKKVVEATNLPDSDSLLESVKNKSQELTNGATGSSAMIEDLEKLSDEVSRLNDELVRSQSDAATSRSKYEKLLRSRQKLSGKIRRQEELISQLQSDYSSLVFESSSLSKQLESLESSLSKARQDMSLVRQESQTRVSELEEKVTRLESSLRESQEFSKKKIREVESLRNQLSSEKRSSSKTIKESVSKGNRLQEDCKRLRNQLSSSSGLLESFRKAYVSEKCKFLGLDLEETLRKTSSCKSVSEIDSVFTSLSDKSRRYRSMSVTDDPLISRLQEGLVTFSEGQFKSKDEEMTRTEKFMDEANRLFWKG